MLLLTHTWILKEFLGLQHLSDDILDVFTYNASPDLLPIHTDITSDMTHGIPRRGAIPRSYSKAAFARFHLLVDDMAHHGTIRKEPLQTFNPDSEGYAYTVGRPLREPLTDFQKSLGREARTDLIAYQTHMIIEMAFDLSLYRGMGNAGSNDLIGLFSEALRYTATRQLDDFGRSLSWLYGVRENTIREAIAWGNDSCTRARMTDFMNGHARVGLFIDKFGLDGDDEKTRKGVGDLLALGFALVGDCEAFLRPTLKAIREFGFVNPL
jgi:hypothetical protein